MPFSRRCYIIQKKGTPPTKLNQVGSQPIGLPVGQLSRIANNPSHKVAMKCLHVYTRMPDCDVTTLMGAASSPLSLASACALAHCLAASNWGFTACKGMQDLSSLGQEWR